MPTVGEPAVYLTRRLASHVSELPFEAIPPDMVALAKDHLVHHVGLALAAACYPRARRARSLAGRLSGGRGRHRVLGATGRYGLLEAVFVNSLLMGEDALDDAALGGTHPGVLVLPAVLALAETKPINGRELLSAVVVGYDVLVVLARGTWTWGVSTPRRSGCVVGPVGVAAVASRLSGFDADRTAHTLGLAANGAVGLIEGTPFARVLYPQVARIGVEAALLASAGFRSTPSVLEGPFGLYETYLGEVPGEVVSAMDGLGTEFGISHAFRKRYPCSGFNVVPVELMDDLIRTTGISGHDVASIRLTLPKERRPREEDFERNFRRYRDAYESRYLTRSASPRFLLAAWMYDGELNPIRYRADVPSDFVDLVDRVSMDFVTGLPLRSARLEVVTTDGQEYVREGHVPSPTPPMEHRDWLAGRLPSASPADVEGFVSLVEQLEELRDASVLSTALERFATDRQAGRAMRRTYRCGSGSTASQRIAAYTTAARYEDFPRTVMERAKDLLVHHLAQALEGRRSAATSPVGRPGNNSAIGQPPSLSLLDAVFANSLSTQNSGRQDHMAGGMRPGALIMPAALALTEGRTLSGRDLLVAIAVGYDTGFALSSVSPSWGATTARRADSVFGPVAVACTAARMLGLDKATTSDAVGQACHLTMGLIEGVEEEAVVNAQLARNGVFAAILAEAGFPAADLMLEGEFGLYRSTLGWVPAGLDDALSGLGARFGLDQAIVSRHSVDHNQLVPIELAGRLSGLLATGMDRPVGVEILLPEIRRRLDTSARSCLRDSGRRLSQADALRLEVGQVMEGRQPGEADARPGSAAARSPLPAGVEINYRHFDDPYFARVTVTTTSGRVERLEGGFSVLPAHLPDRAASLSAFLPPGSRGRVAEVMDLVDGLETVHDASTLLKVMVGACG
ncbi:MAG: MmgE/PrpD family protein [bacterium]|nr:MmgE/PrpD family protein [bacterium]MDE0437803.1 MmgE/PrpD family protein [bacterium]